MKALHHAESAFSHTPPKTPKHTALSQFIGDCHHKLASLYQKISSTSSSPSSAVRQACWEVILYSVCDGLVSSYSYRPCPVLRSSSSARQRSTTAKLYNITWLAQHSKLAYQCPCPIVYHCTVPVSLSHCMPLYCTSIPFHYLTTCIIPYTV